MEGPLREDDLKAQIDVVQSFVAQGVGGIVLAPLSDKGLVGQVKAATAAHVPVVVFDSDLAGGNYVSFVATDNEAAGKTPVTRLAAQVGKGNVVLLRYQEGSASTANREKGFLEAIAAHADVKVASDSQYGGRDDRDRREGEREPARVARGRAGRGAGVFAPNESTTFGMLLALRKAGLAGKTSSSGSTRRTSSCRRCAPGTIDGLVVQRPFEMGYLAVKTIVAHIHGRASRSASTPAPPSSRRTTSTPRRSRPS